MSLANVVQRFVFKAFGGIGVFVNDFRNDKHDQFPLSAWTKVIKKAIYLWIANQPNDLNTVL